MHLKAWNLLNLSMMATASSSTAAEHSPLFVLPNISHLVSVKLDRSNYLLWISLVLLMDLNHVLPNISKTPVARILHRSTQLTKSEIRRINIFLVGLMQHYPKVFCQQCIVWTLLVRHGPPWPNPLHLNPIQESISFERQLQNIKQGHLTCSEYLHQAKFLDHLF